MNIKQAIAQVVEGHDLRREQMYDVFLQLMSGETSDAQIGAFLVALRIKGESIGEITGAVEVMRELVSGVDVSGECLVDIVGVSVFMNFSLNVTLNAVCKTRKLINFSPCCATTDGFLCHHYTLFD